MIRLKPLPLEAWPARDRAAWENVLVPADDLFGEGGRGAHLDEDSIRNYGQAYGIWLRHLADQGVLDPDMDAAARVTPAQLDGWVAAMRAVRRKNGVIRLYLASLHAMLRLIAPDAEVGFILRPRGQSLAAAFPSAPKPFPMVDVEVLMAEVRTLHRRGLANATRREGRVALRDAAIWGVLLRRAPRVSNLAGICLGQHLVEHSDGGFGLRFEEDETKNDRPLGWPLDAECAAMLRDYLRLGRPGFAGAAATDRLWLGTHGGPLEVVGLAAMVRRRSKAWIGVACGPHTARKWLRSTAARRSPGAAFAAAEVMGHGPVVSLRHYAEAVAIGAAQRYADTLARLRRETAGLAARAFGDAAPARRRRGGSGA